MIKYTAPLIIITVLIFSCKKKDTTPETTNITTTTGGLNGGTAIIPGGLTLSIGTVYKFFFGSNGTVTFTSADLANFTVNQPLTIMVNFGNFFSATHNGIKHGFANTLNYQKIAYLK